MLARDVTLKVLTLNLWNTSGPWEARRPRIRAWIDKLDPDLIGFQEVLRAPDGAGIDMADEILDGTGYHVDHAAAGKMNGIDFGNAVASRWRIVDRDEIELPPGDRGEGRCAISVTVDAPFGEVSFTSTHLNWKLHDGHSRELQVVALTDFILKRRPRGGFPPIVVGDFNAEPDSAEIRYMRGFQSLAGRSVMFYDAWPVAGDGGPGYTWSNRNAFASIALEPERRIDYIFTGYPVRMSEEHGMGRIETCRVVCNDEVDGVWPSDHYGVYAELRSEPLPRPAWTMS
jgi:endonuclease/exonuclease/phosphatase family metal-dependent hydrolase